MPKSLLDSGITRGKTLSKRDPGRRGAHLDLGAVDDKSAWLELGDLLEYYTMYYCKVNVQWTLWGPHTRRWCVH